jgi:hypothetical protein
MMSEIMLVPLPRAASRRLMSFLTFQISMFFSASAPWGGCDDMAGLCVCVCLFSGCAQVGCREFCAVRRGAGGADEAAVS